MSIFQAKTKVDDGQLQLQLNGKTVIRDSGEVSKSLKDGESYIVQWFVKGRPGSKYSINISSPKEAEISLTRTLKEDGKDYGGFRFNA